MAASLPEKSSDTGAGGTAAEGQRAGESITVGGWNIGLDDAEVTTIAERIAGFEGVELWGLAEVNRTRAVETLEQAAEEGEAGDFRTILGSSGGGMPLAALYDDSRFDLLEWYELEEINTTGNARAPLVLHLRDTASGEQLLFMVNHLYRTRDEERYRQAELLNEWAAGKTLPVIAVGDYNFDWEVHGGERAHDLGYDLMTADGAWEWVRPRALVTTQCSGWPCRYDSVLDFVFAAGPAREWPAESEIAVEPGDFPDDTRKSDHRPVLATFWPGQEAEGRAVRTGSEVLAPAVRAGQGVGNGCDPSYPTLCIPVGIGDLDCGDIEARRFPVRGPDPHRFDGNHDGVGCEGR